MPGDTMPREARATTQCAAVSIHCPAIIVPPQKYTVCCVSRLWNRSVAKPGHQPIRDYCQSKGIDLDAKGLHFVQGWYTMHAMIKGIEKTLADGKELTGPNIKAALETMSPVDTGGVIGPIKFSADSHRGATSSSIYRVSGGKFSEVAASVVPKA